MRSYIVYSLVASIAFISLILFAKSDYLLKADSPELLKMSKEINSRLPITIDGVIFYGTSVKGNSITFHYKWPGLAANYPMEIIFQAGEDLMKSACNNKAIQPYIEAGVTLFYNYRDSAMGEIYTAQVDKKTCEEFKIK
jgi:hypothetical protein